MGEWFSGSGITDYGISYVGPQLLYNNTVNHNEMNTILPFNVPKLQDKFINSFNDNIVRYLLNKKFNRRFWEDNYFLIPNCNSVTITYLVKILSYPRNKDIRLVNVL